MKVGDLVKFSPESWGDFSKSLVNSLGIVMVVYPESRECKVAWFETQDRPTYRCRVCSQGSVEILSKQ